jgi:hypothetical protein
MLAASVLVFCAGNWSFQKGYFGNTLARSAQFYVQMPDLYDYRLNASINVAEDGNRYKYELSNRYAGKHEFGLIACHDFAFASKDSFLSGLSLSIACSVGNDLVYQRRRQEYMSPWWLTGGREQGFRVWMYQVPEDLPLDRRIECDVIIDHGDREFSERYAICRFYARKEIVE